jgi:CHAT domain-containing protein
VPDGALYYLPFGALVARLPENVEAAADGNVWAAPGLQYAIEKWVISHLPSASMYAAMRRLAAARPPPQRRLCALGGALFDGPAGQALPGAPADPTPLPRLPGTRREAKLALQAFAGPHGVVSEGPGRLRWGQHVALVSAAATEAALRAPEIAQYGYLLLATHGLISPSSAALSYVALTSSATGAADGRLHMMEVLGLHLNARVVTLSGCRTAEGSFARGEGVLGLTAAFYAAGAQAVTASLWAVSDDSTATLMGQYHGAMSAGMSPAAALRSGQLAALKRARATGQSSQAHPYEWGAFVVLGR